MAERDADVLDLLVTQHARIEDLFRQVLATQGQERQESFEQLARLLAVHETAEEEVLHPYARRHIDSGPDVVEARLSEERDAKQILADLYELGVDAPEFDERLLALRAEVLMHAKREERYEFPHLRQVMDASTSRRLASAVRAAETFAPTRPHPGVESATANLATGPVLAIADRVRDAMHHARGDGRAQR